MSTSCGYYQKSVSSQADHDIKRIYNVFILCGAFMLLEIWGHWTSNTLSLLADSIHLLVDLLGFVVSLAALRWTKKRPTSAMPFGYGRVEILGALLSIFLIWIAVGYLVMESYHKYKHPYAINEKIFVAISIVGFVINVVSVVFLHEKSRENMHVNRNLNIRAAYVHVIGDLIQSIGVLFAGIVTYFYPRLVIADIVCTIFFSILVLFTTCIILKDGVQILLERAPTGVDVAAVKKKLNAIESVYEVTDLRIWSISANVIAANATLLLEDVYVKDHEAALKKAKQILKNEYFFNFVNIQIETFGTYYENKVVNKGMVSPSLLIEIPLDNKCAESI